LHSCPKAMGAQNGGILALQAQVVFDALQLSG